MMRAGLGFLILLAALGSPIRAQAAEAVVWDDNPELGCAGAVQSSPWVYSTFIRSAFDLDALFKNKLKIRVADCEFVTPESDGKFVRQHYSGLGPCLFKRAAQELLDGDSPAKIYARVFWPQDDAQAKPSLVEVDWVPIREAFPAMHWYDRILPRIARPRTFARLLQLKDHYLNHSIRITTREPVDARRILAGLPAQTPPIQVAELTLQDTEAQAQRAAHDPNELLRSQGELDFSSSDTGEPSVRLQAEMKWKFDVKNLKLGFDSKRWLPRVQLKRKYPFSFAVSGEVLHEVR